MAFSSICNGIHMNTTAYFFLRYCISVTISGARITDVIIVSTAVPSPGIVEFIMPFLADNYSFVSTLWICLTGCRVVPGWSAGISVVLSITIDFLRVQTTNIQTDLSIRVIDSP